MKNKVLNLPKQSLSEILFFMSYSLYLIFTILHTSFYASYITEYGKISMIVCVVIIIFKELLCNKLSKREFMYLLVCFLLGFILLIHTNGFVMFPLFFLLYGGRQIKLEKIAKVTIVLSGTLFLFIFLSAKFGIITDYVSYVNNRERHYIGFRYALYPSVLFFNITSLILYIDKKGKILKYFLLIILNYIIFKLTDSRLTFYLSVILIILCYLIRKNIFKMDKEKIVTFICVISYIICSVLSLGVIFKYDGTNKFTRNLDTVLEHRITLGKKSLNEYPISLFGHDVEFIGAGLDLNGKRGNKKYNYVDCLYLNMLEKYGLLFLIAYIALMTYSLWNIKKRKQYILLIILLLFAIKGIIDDLGMYLYYNTFWFALGEYIIPKKNKEDS